MEKLLPKLPALDLPAGKLVEQGFKDWSENFIFSHGEANYIKRLWDLYWALESIDMEEIVRANKYGGLQRLFILLDPLQQGGHEDEQKIFAIEDLKIENYTLHPLIYSLMVLFEAKQEQQETDKKLTTLTHWLEDIVVTIEESLELNPFNIKTL